MYLVLSLDSIRHPFDQSGNPLRQIVLTRERTGNPQQIIAMPSTTEVVRRQRSQEEPNVSYNSYTHATPHRENDRPGKHRYNFAATLILRTAIS